MNEGPNCRRKTVSPLPSDSLPSFFCSFRSALGPPLLLPLLSLSASKTKVGPSSMYETLPEVEQRRSQDRNKGGARARKNSESPRKKKRKRELRRCVLLASASFPFPFSDAHPVASSPTTTTKQLHENRTHITSKHKMAFKYFAFGVLALAFGEELRMERARTFLHTLSLALQ